MPQKFQDQRRKLADQGPGKWLESLEPKIAGLRQELAQREPGGLALRSGSGFDPSSKVISVELWNMPYTLAHPEMLARDASGSEVSADRQAMLLMYLNMADGAPIANKWLSYRELPGGMFYANAFHGYAEMRLAQTFDGNLEAFREAALKLGGSALAFGHAAFEFRALPRILVAAVYWLGDEDFPPSASILFDAAASHYLPTDAVGALGSQLVNRLTGRPESGAQTLTALAVQPPPGS